MEEGDGMRECTCYFKHEFYFYLPVRNLYNTAVITEADPGEGLRGLQPPL